jgi:hypothetical protein
MVQAAQPRSIDYARAARIVLGLLDNDIARTNQVLNEANDEDSVHLLIATFVMELVGAMQKPAVSEDGVRKVFEGVIAAVQFDSDPPIPE